MLFLATTGGFFLGAWVCHQWGNHRAKHYKNLLKKSLVLVQNTQDANRIVLSQLEESKKVRRIASCNGMQDGMMRAIADIMADEEAA